MNEISTNLFKVTRAEVILSGRAPHSREATTTCAISIYFKTELVVKCMILAIIILMDILQLQHMLYPDMAHEVMLTP